MKKELRMKVNDIPGLIDGQMLTAIPGNDEVKGGYTSDLLSDVMGNASEGNVLITIQAHKNTIAVANLVGMPAIILCNNREAPEEMIKLAEQEHIAILSTKLNQFVTSWKLGSALEKERKN